MILISLTVAFLGCLVQGTDTDIIDGLKCVTQPDESIICEFHINPTDAKMIMDHQVHQLKHCPKASNICVQAAISTSRQDPKPVTQNENEPSKTKTTTTISRTPSDKTNISVGKATYRPPFSQYGAMVAQHLNQLPSSSTKIEWAAWYMTLGLHHGSMDPELAVVDWVEMELALNAYRQAIETIGTIVESSEEELFVASVYFQMGEIYLLHPEREQDQHGKDALEHFGKAKALYTKLRNAPASKVMDPEDVDLRWADTCTRIGLLLVSSSAHIHQFALDLMAGAMNGGENDDIAEPDMDELMEKVREAEAVLQDAEALLQGAVAVYRAALQKEDNVWARITTQMALGTALQNAAMVASMSGKMDQAMEYNLEALSLHRDDLLPHLDARSPEGEHSKTTTADILLGMADTTLQMGQYDGSKSYYRQALEWHDQHNIGVAPMQNVLQDDGGDTLQQHVDALQHYRSMVEGGTGSKEVKLEGLNDGSDYYYQRDDGYEGDLHAALGALYLSNDDVDKAMAYLENAISLYRTNDDSNSRRMADTKTNLAFALFRARQFQESIRVHTEALEVYRELYGDGVNPLTQGLEDYDDLLGVPVSEVLKRGGGTEGAVEGGVAGGIRIDLSKYKESLKNATEAAKAASPKGADEL